VFAQADEQAELAALTRGRQTGEEVKEGQEAETCSSATS
jgi:hypothetical protein